MRGLDSFLRATNRPVDLGPAVDVLLDGAAENVIRGGVARMCQARGLYSSARNLVPSWAAAGWPSFLEWAGMLVAAARAS